MFHMKIVSDMRPELLESELFERVLAMKCIPSTTILLLSNARHQREIVIVDFERREISQKIDVGEKVRTIDCNETTIVVLTKSGILVILNDPSHCKNHDIMNCQQKGRI